MSSSYFIFIFISRFFILKIYPYHKFIDMFSVCTCLKIMAITVTVSIWSLVIIWSVLPSCKLVNQTLWLFVKQMVSLPLSSGFDTSEIMKDVIILSMNDNFSNLCPFESLNNQVRGLKITNTLSTCISVRRGQMNKCLRN